MSCNCDKCKAMTFGLHEDQITENDPNRLIVATKIIFTNQGTFAVWVGLAKLMPGDSYKVDIDAPHHIRKAFSIRFEEVAESVASNRLYDDEKFLLIQTMSPQI